MRNFATISAMRFLRDEAGPTTVEYAVMLAVLLAAMVGTITYVGNEIQAISERNMHAIDGALTQTESQKADDVIALADVAETSSDMTIILRVGVFVTISTVAVAWFARRGAV